MTINTPAAAAQTGGTVKKESSGGLGGDAPSVSAFGKLPNAEDPVITAERLLQEVARDPELGQELHRAQRAWSVLHGQPCASVAAASSVRGARALVALLTQGVTSVAGDIAAEMEQQASSLEEQVSQLEKHTIPDLCRQLQVQLHSLPDPSPVCSEGMGRGGDGLIGRHEALTARVTHLKNIWARKKDELQQRLSAAQAQRRCLAVPPGSAAADGQDPLDVMRMDALPQISDVSPEVQTQLDSYVAYTERQTAVRLQQINDVLLCVRLCAVMLGGACVGAAIDRSFPAAGKDYRNLILKEWGDTRVVDWQLLQLLTELRPVLTKEIESRAKTWHTWTQRIQDLFEELELSTDDRTQLLPTDVTAAEPDMAMVEALSKGQTRTDLLSIFPDAGDLHGRPIEMSGCLSNEAIDTLQSALDSLVDLRADRQREILQQRAVILESLLEESRCCPAEIEACQSALASAVSPPTAEVEGDCFQKRLAAHDRLIDAYRERLEEVKKVRPLYAQVRGCMDAKVKLAERKEDKGRLSRRGPGMAALIREEAAMEKRVKIFVVRGSDSQKLPMLLKALGDSLAAFRLKFGCPFVMVEGQPAPGDSRSVAESVADSTEGGGAKSDVVHPGMAAGEGPVVVSVDLVHQRLIENNGATFPKKNELIVMSEQTATQEHIAACVSWVSSLTSGTSGPLLALTAGSGLVASKPSKALLSPGTTHQLHAASTSCAHPGVPCKRIRSCGAESSMPAAKYLRKT